MSTGCRAAPRSWCGSRAGHNAGHTLVIGNTTYKLSLLPSGVVRPGKLSIIGNGVVVDPWHLLKEIEGIRAKGVEITPDSLKLAENAALILPVHAALDVAREAARGAKKIGTTGRGIGPAYEDKVGRRAIRVCDLAEPETLGEKVDHLLFHHNMLLRGLGQPGRGTSGVARQPDRDRAQDPALCRTGVAAARRGEAGPGGASSTRARRR